MVLGLLLEQEISKLVHRAHVPYLDVIDHRFIQVIILIVRVVCIILLTNSFASLASAFGVIVND